MQNEYRRVIGVAKRDVTNFEFFEALPSMKLKIIGKPYSFLLGGVVNRIG